MRGAIEEEQSGDLAGMVERQPLHGEGADIVADEARAFDAELVHQGRNVVGQDIGTGLIGRSRYRVTALAEAAKVRRDQPIAIGQALEHRLPHRPEFRPAMQQDQRRAVAALGDMGGEAAGLDKGVLEGRHGWTSVMPTRGHARGRKTKEECS